MSGKEQLAKYYLRFNGWQRLEHMALLISFTVLAITGLPQKFTSQFWATSMIGVMGGIEWTRLVHHVAAVILLVASIYHFVMVAYKVYVKRVSLTMLPDVQDMRDGLQALAYNVGI